jgi:TatD DNase family protein
MFIDTHTHLFSEQFKDDINEVINRAINSKVDKMLLPNIDVQSIESMLNLANSFPKNCFPMFGLHPCSVGADFKIQLEIIKKYLLLNKKNCIAIGEIGIDLYWDKTYFEEQKIAFIEQIKWAKNLQIPIVIHARDSFEEIIDILNKYYDSNLKGVFHCFSGTYEQALKAISFDGFKLGIGGILTYKNSNLPEVISKINLNNIIIETDSPYLAPSPFRGKRNESSYLIYIAQKLADIYGVTLKTIEEQTTKNAIELFNL